MAKLHKGVRDLLPKSEFGLPGSRKYPMPDRSHVLPYKKLTASKVSES